MLEKCELPNNRKPDIKNVIKGSLILSIINFIAYNCFVVVFYVITEYYFHHFNINHKGISIHTLKTLSEIPVLRYIVGALIGFPFESIFIVLLISGFSYLLYNTLIYDNLKNFYPYSSESNPDINEDEDRYMKIIKSLFSFMTPFGIYILLLVGIILFQKFAISGISKFKFTLYLIWFIGLIITSIMYFGVIIGKNYFGDTNLHLNYNNTTSDLVYIFTIYSVYLYARCIGFKFNLNIANSDEPFKLISTILYSLFFYLVIINILFFLVNFIQGFYIKMWVSCKK